MSKNKLLVCKSCHRPSEELADGQTPDGTHLFNQLNDLSKAKFGADNIEIEAVECLWACNRGCAIAACSDEKPTYLFVDLVPDEKVNTGLLEFMKLYIKSRKGNIPFKKIPETLQEVIAALIPVVK